MATPLRRLGERHFQGPRAAFPGCTTEITDFSFEKSRDSGEPSDFQKLDHLRSVNLDAAPKRFNMVRHWSGMINSRILSSEYFFFRFF